MRPIFSTRMSRVGPGLTSMVASVLRPTRIRVASRIYKKQNAGHMRHFWNAKGTRAEKYPARVSGFASGHTFRRRQLLTTIQWRLLLVSKPA